MSGGTQSGVRLLVRRAGHGECTTEDLPEMERLTPRSTRLAIVRQLSAALALRKLLRSDCCPAQKVSYCPLTIPVLLGFTLKNGEDLPGPASNRGGGRVDLARV
jgi:hypothetical protein